MVRHPMASLHRNSSAVMERHHLVRLRVIIRRRDLSIVQGRQLSRVLDTFRAR